MCQFVFRSIALIVVVVYFLLFRTFNVGMRNVHVFMSSYSIYNFIVLWAIYNAEIVESKQTSNATAVFFFAQMASHMNT